MSFAYTKILVGILCFVALGYWIFALHFALPGSAALHEIYSSTHRGGRRGPWPFWLLTFGGLALIGSGLRDLGVSRDDPT